MIKTVLICGARSFVGKGLAEKINVQTCEDIYHPYGMFDFKDMDDYFTRWNNMLVVTTGCLSRLGGINPTGSMLPVVGELVEKHLNNA